MSSCRDFFADKPSLTVTTCNGCTHGCNDSNTSSTNHFEDGGTITTYPFHSTAVFIIDRILFHLLDDNRQKTNEEKEADAKKVHGFFQLDDGKQKANDDDELDVLGITKKVHCDLGKDREHKDRYFYVQDDLIESCLMMGTDLLMQSSNGKDQNFAVAAILGKLTGSMVNAHALWQPKPDNRSGVLWRPNKLDGATAAERTTFSENMDMDCPVNVIRFYKKRIPCTCLDQIQQQAEQDQGCCYKGCSKKTPAIGSPDSIKLHQCSGCRSVKYCDAECQKADWSHHKKLCKLIQKEFEKSKKTTNHTK